MNIKSEVSRKGFIKHIGGIEFKKISENNFEFKTSVKEFNLNSQGISHGGYLATILDSGMGSAAHMVIGEGKNCVTISLDIKFIGGSKENDILVGKVLITKKTPTKLPLEIIKKLLDYSSEKKDIVFDPFLGW